MCLARDIPADKLSCDAFRYPEDVPSVFVVVAHQRFTAELATSRRIIEPPCDLFLHVDVQYVGGPSGRIMQIRAQPQEKIISLFNSPLIAFAQPVLSYELIGAERSFLEVRHPKQILIIAQSATSALQVGLEEIYAVAEFLVARDLIFHAHFNVFSLVSLNAL